MLAELSQDPMSQPSDENDVSSGMTREYAKPRKIFQTKVRPRPGKGFENIDISEFRMPTTQTESTRYYSDGFEGREAHPIGRFMPVRRPKQAQSFIHKITLKMGELALVAERAFGVELEEGRVRRREGRRGLRNLPFQRGHVRRRSR